MSVPALPSVHVGLFSLLLVSLLDCYSVSLSFLLFKAVVFYFYFPVSSLHGEHQVLCRLCAIFANRMYCDMLLCSDALVRYGYGVTDVHVHSAGPHFLLSSQKRILSITLVKLLDLCWNIIVSWLKRDLLQLHWCGTNCLIEWRLAVERLRRETKWPDCPHHGELHEPVPWGQGNQMLLIWNICY